ncbi:response regulator, partial [Klebsiella pneumoniae]|uniref:response regulator n=1 Tax=Klebsiella pneumoniae TaxID=573 RepID=UPI003EE11E3A
EASCGAEALRIAATEGKNIALVLTDVVMPEMNGREVAARLTQQSPALKTLFMSGYNEESIDHIDVVGERLLRKPLDLRSL